MPGIHHKQLIFDGDAFAAELQDLAPRMSLDISSQESVIAAPLRQTYDHGRNEIEQRFMASLDGRIDAAEQAWLMDMLIGSLCELAAILIDRPGTPIPIAVVAVGGYGRGELSPYSDIDLLFLHAPQDEEQGGAIARFLLHHLWLLGIRVGHALRTVDDCIAMAQDDISIHTALLDARLITGFDTLFEQFQRQFQHQIVERFTGSFITGKLAERHERHQRLGDSRYMLEPNIKEGKGGLRDLQTLRWIAQHTFQIDHMHILVKRGLLTRSEYQSYSNARAFYFKIRACMHYGTRRAEEKLTFDLQQTLSQQLRYDDQGHQRGVERFMKRYFLTAREIGNLTRVLCTILEEEHSTSSLFPIPSFLKRMRKFDDYIVKGRRLTFASDQALATSPSQFIGIFLSAQQHELDIHPEALRMIGRNLKLIDRSVRDSVETNQLFMNIIMDREHNPAIALKRMNEANVLGKFIPDFGRIVGQMQFDMYHSLTVDEHTLYAISILHDIEQGALADALPVASQLVGEISMRRALYIALLLHDTAKGRGGNHSDMGATIARRLCPRLGLNPHETDTVAWLVQHHLLFTHTAFKRDIQDPETVSGFVEHIQSPERLKLLLLLSVADMRAVSPTVWNEWKASLLRELYNHAAEQMGGSAYIADRQRRAVRMRSRIESDLANWSADERERYLTLPHDSFWLGMSFKRHQSAAALIYQTLQADYPFCFRFIHNSHKALTELMICSSSQHALFAQIAGGCALSNISVIHAKIFTLPIGVTLLQFDIQTREGLPLRSDKRKEKLIDAIRDLISRETPLNEVALPHKKEPGRTRVFKVPPTVLIDNRTSRDYTIIEVSARDRIGLLFTIAKALAELKLLVATSHISTYGEKAVDVFYVRDLTGQKIIEATKLDHIRTSLQFAVEQHQ